MSVSKNQAKKAAKRLVEFINDDRVWDEMSEARRAEVSAAFDIVSDWRSSYAQPLLSVRMSLQSFVRTTGVGGSSLSQRHKRLPRIITKLARYPTMQITTMGDIGGCRIILPALDELHTLSEHVQQVWASNIVRVNDYIVSPKPDGYRAIHVVSERNGRRIETQLRTERQHVWADAVERLSRRFGQELKWGDMPTNLASILQPVSARLAGMDREGIPYQRDDFTDIFNEVADERS